MRVGQNPLKTDIQKLTHKKHRVIMPFWIPNTNDAYFKGQPAVLDMCLKSLTETIDKEHTAITLINNASCKEATDVANKYFEDGLIDKYVSMNENRGKLETILTEARASYEEYITIGDSDFLFFPGWEQQVAEIMNNFPLAGMVTPFPAAHLAYFFNSNIITTSLKSGKIIDDADIDLFEQGLGHAPDKGLSSRYGFKRKESWRNRHYYVGSNNRQAIVGAVHALATYRRVVVDGFNHDKVEHVFRNGYEHEYIDFSAERQGLLRLSTKELYAYHMGNTIPEKLVASYQKMKETNPTPPIVDWKESAKQPFFRKAAYPLTEIFFRAFRKFKII